MEPVTAHITDSANTPTPSVGPRPPLSVGVWAPGQPLSVELDNSVGLRPPLSVGVWAPGQSGQCFQWTVLSVVFGTKVVVGSKVVLRRTDCTRERTTQGIQEHFIISTHARKNIFATASCPGTRPPPPYCPCTCRGASGSRGREWSRSLWCRGRRRRRTCR